MRKPDFIDAEFTEVNPSRATGLDWALRLSYFIVGVPILALVVWARPHLYAWVFHLING